LWLRVFVVKLIDPLTQQHPTGAPLDYPESQISGIVSSLARLCQTITEKENFYGIDSLSQGGDICVKE
jgi:hypothetical protein